MHYSAFINTPIGRLTAVEKDGALVFLGLEKAPREGALEKETPLLAGLRVQLGEYFAGTRKRFDIPLAPETGTPWQRKCWEGLLAISYGETRTYGYLASFAGNACAARAAGGACHANPILILIPCHRVIGKNGSLTGFGAGMDAKERLLALEKAGLS